MREEIEKIIATHFKFECYDYDKGNMYISNDYGSLVSDIEKFIDKKILENAGISSTFKSRIKDLERSLVEINKLN